MNSDPTEKCRMGQALPPSSVPDHNGSDRDAMGSGVSFVWWSSPLFWRAGVFDAGELLQAQPKPPPSLFQAMAKW